MCQDQEIQKHKEIAEQVREAFNAPYVVAWVSLEGYAGSKIYVPFSGISEHRLVLEYQRRHHRIAIADKLQGLVSRHQQPYKTWFLATQNNINILASCYPQFGGLDDWRGRIPDWIYGNVVRHLNEDVEWDPRGRKGTYLGSHVIISECVLGGYEIECVPGTTLSLKNRNVSYGTARFYAWHELRNSIKQKKYVLIVAKEDKVEHSLLG